MDNLEIICILVIVLGAHISCLLLGTYKHFFDRSKYQCYRAFTHIVLEGCRTGPTRRVQQHTYNINKESTTKGKELI